MGAKDSKEIDAEVRAKITQDNKKFHTLMNDEFIYPKQPKEHKIYKELEEIFSMTSITEDQKAFIKQQNAEIIWKLICQYRHYIKNHQEFIQFSFTSKGIDFVNILKENFNVFDLQKLYDWLQKESTQDDVQVFLIFEGYELLLNQLIKCKNISPKPQSFQKQILIFKCFEILFNHQQTLNKTLMLNHPAFYFLEHFNANEEQISSIILNILGILCWDCEANHILVLDAFQKLKEMRKFQFRFQPLVEILKSCKQKELVRDVLIFINNVIESFLENDQRRICKAEFIGVGIDNILLKIQEEIQGKSQHQQKSVQEEYREILNIDEENNIDLQIVNQIKIFQKTNEDQLIQDQLDEPINIYNINQLFEAIKVKTISSQHFPHFLSILQQMYYIPSTDELNFIWYKISYMFQSISKIQQKGLNNDLDDLKNYIKQSSRLEDLERQLRLYLQNIEQRDKEISKLNKVRRDLEQEIRELKECVKFSEDNIQKQIGINMNLEKKYLLRESQMNDILKEKTFELKNVLDKYQAFKKRSFSKSELGKELQQKQSQINELNLQVESQQSKIQQLEKMIHSFSKQKNDQIECIINELNGETQILNNNNNESYQNDKSQNDYYQDQQQKIDQIIQKDEVTNSSDQNQTKNKEEGQEVSKKLSENIKLQSIDIENTQNFDLKNSGKKNTSTSELQQLDWILIRNRDLEKTVWENQLVYVNFDKNLLQSEFQTNEKDIKQQKKLRLISYEKSKFINRNLSFLKCSSTLIAEFLMQLNSNLFTQNQIDQLLQILPSQKDIEILQGFQGCPEDLNNAEKFIWDLARVPKFQERLIALRFKQQSQDLLQDLEFKADASISIYSSFFQNQILKDFLKYVLEIGNFLNNSQETGFKIESLSLLKNFKSNSSKQSLIYYLINWFENQLHTELFDTSEDFRDIQMVQQNPIIQLQKFKQELDSQIQIMGIAIESQSCEYHDQVKEFFNQDYVQIKLKFDVIKKKIKQAECEFKNLCQYFLESPAENENNQLISIFLNLFQEIKRIKQTKHKQIAQENNISTIINNSIQNNQVDDQQNFNLEEKQINQNSCKNLIVEIKEQEDLNQIMNIIQELKNKKIAGKIKPPGAPPKEIIKSFQEQLDQTHQIMKIQNFCNQLIIGQIKKEISNKAI